MTDAVGRLVVVTAGLFLLLSYLLLRGTPGGIEQRERRLQALDAITLHQATLHRDVLRARTGLLRNYDPLVAEIEALRRAAAGLDGASRGGPANVGEQIGQLVAEINTEESLLDRFKSANALLQNSLSYFAHVSARLGALSGDDAPISVAVGTLANAMFRFVGAPSDETAAAVASALYRIDGFALSGPVRPDAEALTAHGWLIVTALPTVDETMGRLLSDRLSAQAQSLQDHLLADYRRTEAQATVFRVLLYLTALALLAYLIRLYFRLHGSARAVADRSRALQARSDFERLLAGLSAGFIDRPPQHTEAGLRLGVARLGQHVGAQTAYALISTGEPSGLGAVHAWAREQGSPKRRRDEWADLLTIGLSWSPKSYSRLGCLVVPNVAALPEGHERETLQRCGIAAWLCVPLSHAGRQIGILGLELAAGERSWPDDDLHLVRLAGEILANAIGRQRTEEARAALEQRLQQAQRMEAIGTLAGGIAHNFNNILGAILGYAEMALAELPRGSRPRRHVDEVRQAGERAKGIIDQILTFGRRVEPRRESIRMAALVDEAARLLHASFPATIAMRTSVTDDGAAIVDGDASQLQQVIVNLGANAAQAMAERGVIDVSVDTIDFAEERGLSHGSLAAGRYVRLTVRDSGPGIDPAILDRIFEPFFTTKHTHGTGLGLATVHGIVTDHDGALHVWNRPDGGSVFEVYLPRGRAQPAADRTAELSPPRGRGETILLVEDDEPLRLLAEEMLAMLGYEPVGVASGTIALAAIDAEPQRFDLLLADEVMPEMTGTQLAAAAHRLWPDLPILLMTGYAGALRRPHDNGVRTVLRKPLRQRDLARHLARHLRGPDIDARHSA